MVGLPPTLNDAYRVKCEKFLCALYPAVKKTSSTADELRYLMFCQKRHKSELLPPTPDSICQHARRATYQTYIWRMALTGRQHLPPPEENGWEKIADTLTPHYMTKDPAPSTLLELTTCQCSKSACQRNWSCANINLACTEACMCMGSVDSCSNPNGTLVDTDNDDDDSSLQSE